MDSEVIGKSLGLIRHAGSVGVSLAENFISAILHPIKWFANQKVDNLAETIAIRQAVFRETVRLNVEYYSQQAGSEVGLDPDRARGLWERVIAELQDRFDWAKDDPEGVCVRTEIKKAVTKAITPVSVWVKLRHLRENEPFDTNLSAVLEYRDGHGATHHSTEYVAALQRHFPFFKPFAFSDAPDGSGVLRIRAKLTPEISAMVEDRLKNEPIELLRFELLSGVPDPLATFSNLRAR